MFDKLYQWLIQSWKTTATSIATTIALLLANYGVTLSEAAQQRLSTLILAAGMLLLGIFSKDGDKKPHE